MNSRFMRGQLVAKQCNVRKIDQACFWKVQSQSNSMKEYNVVLRDEEGLSCDCEDYTRRQELCKHCYAVMIRTGGVQE
jgi:uncharacterized Zn finger protein